MVMPLRSDNRQKKVVSRVWSTIRLKDIIVGTMTYGINAPAVSYSKQLPKYIRITDISDEGKFKPNPLVSVDCEDTSTYSLKEGDVLFARTGNTTGKSYVYVNSDGALVFAGFLIKATINKNIANPRFVFYYTQSEAYWKWVKENSMRSGQPGINSTQYSNLPLPYPPILEQNAIASVLTNLDNLIESLKKLIAKKKLIKEGAMQILLTGKKRLAGFDGDWVEISFEDLFTIAGNYSATRNELSQNGHCYLHYGDIHESTSSFIDTDVNYSNIPKLDVSLKLINPASLLKDGDIVFVDASEDDEGTSKHIVIKNKGEVPFISGLHTIVAHPKTKLLSRDYCGYCFKTNLIKKQFKYYSTGTKVAGISKANLSRIIVKIPPTLEEQNAIAKILINMDNEITALEEKLDKYKQIKTGEMQQLLTGKIRLSKE